MRVAENLSVVVEVHTTREHESDDEELLVQTAASRGL
jgi:hypothetical protein